MGKPSGLAWNIGAIAAAAVFLTAGPIMAQSASLGGLVRAEGDHHPLPNAVVEIDELRRTALTDEAGQYSFENLPAGRFRVTARAFGYAEISSELDSNGTEAYRLDFTLRLQPLRLRPLTGVGERSPEGGAVERALWEREVAVGLVGMSGREIRDIPVLAEADVLRSLQALPDVLPLNDLSARLHVQGGGADQNMYLWDGARVFAPYHMFGIFGAFNADAVGRAEFYRGHIPARFGGVLSSVVDIAPLAATTDALSGVAGAGLLGLRATARGQARNGDAQWLVAGRRTHADILADRLLDRDFPYGFFDLQAHGSLRLSDHDEISASGFASSDRFSMFLDGFDGSMDSRWRNGAISARWSREKESSATSARVWGSGYRGSLTAGGADVSPTATNGVTAAGIAVDHARSGRAVGYRLGLDIERGAVELLGSDPAAYVFGDVDDGYVQASGYGELEGRIGPVRLRPGLRFSRVFSQDRTFAEPRFSARIQLTDDMAVTAGAERTHQFLSTIRDDRFVVPGAPFWLIHPEETPASRSDRLSLALEAWHGRSWSVEVGGYARRFEDVIRWRPVGLRTLDQVAFDDGTAAGTSVMLRRHEGRLTGWVGYSASKVQLTEEGTGRGYAPAWDRRHAADAALFFKPSTHVTLSLRAVYASGPPFWPQVGEVDGLRFSPIDGSMQLGEPHPVWGDTQLRMPDYFRLDGAVRFTFSAAGYDLEGYAGMLNLGLEPNVLYYKLVAQHGNEPDGQSAVLRPAHLIPAFPSVGLTVRF